MTRLVRLFGSPRLHAGEVWLEPPPEHLLLLIAFLLSRGEWVERGEVVALFWPEEDEKKARHNLSQLLYRHRKLDWLAPLEADAKRLRYPLESDLQHFREAVADGRWGEALEVYQGEFLAGIHAEQLLGVSEWLEQERMGLHQAWREASLRRAQQLVAEGQHEEASGCLKSVLQRDPLAEDVLQAYMRAAAASDQRDQALRAFETFQEGLRRELDMAPLPASQDLAQAIRGSQASDPVQRQAPSLRGFPAAATPFVGRDIERAEIMSALQRESCRLLTLVGPGGIGKSRTAREVAQGLGLTFPEGAVFVPLAGVSSAAQVPAAILHALDIPSGADPEPKRALFAALHDESLLLVLDNVEHLLDAAGDVAELITAAPKIKILATSREPLRLRAEHLYELHGLDLPPDAGAHHAEVYDAVRLFINGMQQVNPSALLTPEDHRLITAICRLLQGVPLAIELAANWTRLLSLAELQSALHESFDVLEAEQRDAPPRHRSLRSVFEQSWALLSAQECSALARLSVFRSSFTKQAAQRVSQSSLRTLLALVNRSLLARTPQGRFDMLEVIRQYAAEKRAARAGDEALSYQNLSEYCLQLAEATAPRLLGEAQPQLLAELALEHTHFRTALDWLANEGAYETGARLANALYWFWHIRGHYSEGRHYYRTFLAHPLPGAVRAEALWHQSSHASSQGDFGQAQRLTGECLEHYRALEDPVGIGRAHWQLGCILRDERKFEAAEQQLLKAEALQRDHNEHFGLSMTTNDLGLLAVYQGRYEVAEGYFHESLELKRALGETQGIAYALGNLATVAELRGGDLLEVAAKHQESLTLKRQLGDRRALSKTLYRLGNVALRQGDVGAAAAHYHEALEHALAIGEKISLVDTLGAVCGVLLEQRRWAQVAQLSEVFALLKGRYQVTLPAELEASLATMQHTASRELGEASYAEARARGVSMSLRELVAYAQDALQSSGQSLSHSR